MEFAFPRTQNKVEAWHRRWKTLIGRSHVGIFTIVMVKQIRKERNEVDMEIEKSIRGEPVPKKRKLPTTKLTVHLVFALKYRVCS